jgi:hypothetical protein
MNPYIYSDGVTIGMSEFGTAVFTCVVAIVNVKIAFMCHRWTWLHHVSIWGAIVLVPLVSFVMEKAMLSPAFTGTIGRLMASPVFYISFVVSVLGSMLPVIAIEGYQAALPTIRNRLRDRGKETTSPYELPLDQ